MSLRITYYPGLSGYCHSVPYGFKSLRKKRRSDFSKVREVKELSLGGNVCVAFLTHTHSARGRLPVDPREYLES